MFNVRKYRNLEIITLQNPRIFSSNCYIVLSDDAFTVIDPSVSYEDAISVYTKLGDLKAEYVLLTHGHVDHFWEIDSYLKRGARVIISEKDAEIMSKPEMNCSEFLDGNINSYSGEYATVNDGDTVETVGKTFCVIATPGHTAGSVSFKTEDVIFTGDTLFADGVFGRYDLPTSDGIALLHSLKRLFALPDHLTVYSGHGRPTTLKNTKDSFYNRREI
ncbi:MAG: MBL fold metallo-hydrolase [Ruminococcaceae bacterium]|nr:MBL fold metallo-hydrolase [Oscillospiraceae bacterium]